MTNGRLRRYWKHFVLLFLAFWVPLTWNLGAVAGIRSSVRQGVQAVDGLHWVPVPLVASVVFALLTGCVTFVGLHRHYNWTAIPSLLSTRSLVSVPDFPRPASGDVSVHATTTRLLSWPRRHPVGSRSDFESARGQISLHQRLDDAGVPFSVVILGLPFSSYVLGLVVATLTGTVESFRTDPVPLVFVGVSLVFLWTLSIADRLLFEIVHRIRETFDVSEERYYSFFGLLVERLFEPIPGSGPAATSLHPPATALFVAGVTYVVSLVVTGAGRFPVDSPLLVQWYYWSLTVAGLVGIVFMAWIAVVMAVFMGVAVRAFPVRIVLTGVRDNLGLESYGKLVTATTWRTLVALGIGGIAMVLRPSPFIITVFAFVATFVVTWFVVVQYGVHRSIVASKEAAIRRLERQHSSDVLGPISARELEDMESVVAVERQIRRLPNWPVGLANVVTVLNPIAVLAVEFGLALLPYLQ